MSDKTPAATPAPALAALRQEIDRIDEAMHRLLMERGRIIDRLIAVKKTGDSGSAFRPGREASMMRALAERHERPAAARHGRGHLARHHRHVHLCAGSVSRSMRTFPAATRPMRDSARFHFGFTVPFLSHPSAAAVIDAVADSRGDLGIFRLDQGASSGRVVANSRRARQPRRSSPGCPSSSVPAIPAGTPVFVISKPLTDAAVRDVVLYAAQFERWHRGRAARRCGRWEARWWRAPPTRAACPSSSPIPGSVDAQALRAALDRGRREPRRSGRGRQPCRTFPREMSANAALEPCQPTRELRRLREVRRYENAAGTQTMAARPEPRPGVMQIDAYVPGKSAASGVAKIHKLSSNETPLGPSPKAIEAIRAVDHLELYPDGSATQLREAIAAKYGLDPARIVCGSGSDELLSLIAARLCGAGRRGHLHGARLSGLPDRDPGRRRHARRGAGERTTRADVDAILAAVTPRTKIVFLANPEQPDRHLSAVRRGQAPACGPAARTCCWCSTRPMPNMSAATTTRRASNSCASAENVVMTRTFSKIYGLANAAARLDGRAGRMSSTRSTASAARSTSTARRWRPGIAAIRTTAHVASAVAHNEQWLRLADRARSRRLGLDGDAERRQFPADPFPDDAGRTAPRTPTPS